MKTLLSELSGIIYISRNSHFSFPRRRSFMQNLNIGISFSIHQLLTQQYYDILIMIQRTFEVQPYGHLYNTAAAAHNAAQRYPAPRDLFTRAFRPTAMNSSTRSTTRFGYYRDYITRNPAWTFIDGYIDEGLSGMTTRKRDNFQRMVQDAKDDKFRPHPSPRRSPVLPATQILC